METIKFSPGFHLSRWRSWQRLAWPVLEDLTVWSVGGLIKLWWQWDAHPGRRCRNWALPFLNVQPLGQDIEGRLWRVPGRQEGGGGGRLQICQGCASPSCCKKVEGPLTTSLVPPKRWRYRCYLQSTVCDSRSPTWEQWEQGWLGWPSVQQPAPRCSRCCLLPRLFPASPSCAFPKPPTACSGPGASLSIPRCPSKWKG